MIDRHFAPCGYGGDRDEVLVAYLYDDIQPAERGSFEAHLAACARCRTELADLGGVRRQLGRWAPPEPRQSTIDGPRSAVGRAWWREVPVWAQVAAALLVLGTAAGVANLDVRYNHQDGLTVRTGWSKAPVAAQGPSAPLAAPWRTDLTALEQQLRAEFRAAEAANAARPVSAPGASEADLVRRVRGLLAESERRQQRELALRLAEVLRDVSAQRASDLVRIDRSLGIVQNNTGVEVAKQRELLNYLVRVSSQK